MMENKVLKDENAKKGEIIDVLISKY